MKKLLCCVGGGVETNICKQVSFNAGAAFWGNFVFVVAASC